MTGDLRPRRLDPARLKPLQDWLAGALEARAVAITGAEILGGGAIGENWLIRAEVEGGARAGSHDWVLRTDAVARLDISHDRTHEFALIKAAHAAGVKVPEPVATCPDEALIGAPFMIVGRVAGTAQGRVLVRDAAVAANREALVHEIGRQLARIHSIRPPRDDLSFLPLPEEPPARAQITLLRRCLDSVSSPQPALEFILSWLEERVPESGGLVLCHTDFRTGNIMIDQGRLTGILDWEFCHWGDPHFDLAWFCARCW
ncbi:MAG: phosphotransferase family protein, partial [Alphaproteobacteria bacterium]